MDFGGGAIWVDSIVCGDRCQVDDIVGGAIACLFPPVFANGVLEYEAAGWCDCR